MGQEKENKPAQGNKTPAGNDLPPVFAFVALKQLSKPTVQDVEKALKSSFPEGTKIENVQVDDKAVTFSVDGQAVTIVLAEFPIPWGDLEGPCATCWHWKDATAQMKQQKAHLIVHLASEKGTLVDRCIVLTRVLAAATKIFDSIGIYWGNGPVVMSTEEMQKWAPTITADNLPLMVWIDFRVEKNEDGTCNVLTSGLNYFRCMEVEVINSKKKPGEVLEMVMGIADISLKGDKFKDGDTVGPDDKTKIKTHYDKSQWDRPGKVLRIEM